MSNPAHIPMPGHCELAATVRDMGSLEVPVARVAFIGPLGERMVMDFDERVALELAIDLLRFVKQVRP